MTIDKIIKSIINDNIYKFHILPFLNNIYLTNDEKIRYLKNKIKIKIENCIQSADWTLKQTCYSNLLNNDLLFIRKSILYDDVWCILITISLDKFYNYIDLFENTKKISIMYNNNCILINIYINNNKIHNIKEEIFKNLKI
jgi:hypothetical protein